MTRVRGEFLSQSGAWSVLPAQPILRASGSMRATAFRSAPHGISYGWFRSMPSGYGQPAGSRVEYKLHNEGVRDSVRG